MSSTRFPANIADISPDPPAHLVKEERRRWIVNSEALKRWSGTETAFRDFTRGVPPWVIEKFCREIQAAYNGGGTQDISGVLWDFIQEGKKG